jgi:hypothetical protein
MLRERKAGITGGLARMLSLATLRLLHRHLDDFTLVHKVRSGTMAAAELERILRDSGAEAQEIKDALTDYQRHRSE